MINHTHARTHSRTPRTYTFDIQYSSSIFCFESQLFEDSVVDWSLGTLVSLFPSSAVIDLGYVGKRQLLWVVWNLELMGQWELLKLASVSGCWRHCGASGRVWANLKVQVLHPMQFFGS